MHLKELSEAYVHPGCTLLFVISWLAVSIDKSGRCTTYYNLSAIGVFETALPPGILT